MKARKTASFGKPYLYSQMTYDEAPWHPGLIPVVDLLQSRLNIRFNNCLLNYYETGKKRMGFHSDSTVDLVPGTGVAIVSLGSERTITFRAINDPALRVEHLLTPGSLLYMDAEIQQHWQHSIQKQSGAGPRISLTWRAVAEEEDQA